MLEKIDTPSKDIVAFEVLGNLTQQDYSNTVIPLVLKARENGEKLKFLLYFGGKFEGFTPSAAWEDFKLGLQHMNVFERIAVVSDKTWILNATSFFGSLMPCSVKVYKNNELSSAMAWLNSGEIGFNHTLDQINGVLVAEITGPLTSNNFSLMSHTVDSWIENKGELKALVIHTKKFPGWEDIGSLISHIQFVKNHHRKIKKVALAADIKLANLFPKLANHFVEAEIKHFAYNQLDEAKAWACQ